MPFASCVVVNNTIEALLHQGVLAANLADIGLLYELQ